MQASTAAPRATQIAEFVQAARAGAPYKSFMLRSLIALVILGACASAAKGTSMHGIEIDLEKTPDLCFRVDSFVVPDAARAEFEARMRENLAVLHTLSGFRGHVVFEKTGGPTTFTIVTIAVWENAAALERAGLAVRAHYQKVGFDMPATLARWGVKGELGNFRAPRELQ